MLDKLGVTPNKITNAIGSCSMPWDIMERCCDDTGVSMDWLRTGITPKFQLTAEIEQVVLKAFTDVVYDHDRYKYFPRPTAGLSEEEAAKDLFKYKLTLENLPGSAVEKLKERVQAYYAACPVLMAEPA